MLTEASTRVDGRPREGLWLSVSELAAERGVSKQAVSKNLARWQAAGTPVTMRRDGRALMVNVAEYDRVKGAAGDQVRDQEPAAPQLTTAPANDDPIFAREQARRMAYEADLKKLQLDEALGRLIPIANVEKATITCGEAMLRAIDHIVIRSEELGIPRPALKLIAHDLRARASEEFAKLAAVASKQVQDELPTDIDDA